jgi:uncharacterized protein with PQ loop repeat
MMAVLSHERVPVNHPPAAAPVSGLERIVRLLSVLTMLMTVPQVLTIWVGGNAAGVSLVSWLAYLFAAFLWFVYGLQKHDKTIYLACVGWVILDAAVVIGVIVHR